ncbi:MAG: hypothetical protein IKW28_08300 [Lachnospiraceae bacterium]|nr:hypothetical protein [Lachnospiraceae bacterium]
MPGISYSVHKNRLEEGYFPGFVLKDRKLLQTGEEDIHYFYCKAIDSTEEDSHWGRLSFQMNLEENMACFVYVTAKNEAYFYRENQPKKIEDFLCDEKESHDLKKKFMKMVGAKKSVNEEDILLYDQKGRYLYFFIEVIGKGKGSIGNIRVEQQGDTFMNTFPDVYREHNSFFHRYLSIFSTIYNEFEERIDALPKMLDLDTCPLHLLPVYASWMGVEIKEEFFTEEILRKLVKNIYYLNQRKGTKAAIERIIEIIFSEKPMILEKNQMADYVEASEYKEFERLYGKSNFDVTILIKKELTEIQKNQLMFLLEQYKPVRCRLHVIGLQQTGTLDSYSYLDLNAGIWEKSGAKLDEKTTMDSVMILG